MARIDAVPLPRNHTWIYIFERGDSCKIGITRNLGKRAGAIMIGYKTPIYINLAIPIPSQAARSIERIAHELLGPNHAHGEWFDIDAIAAEDAIVRAIGEYSRRQAVRDISRGTKGSALDMSSPEGKAIFRDRLDALRRTMKMRAARNPNRQSADRA